MHARAGPHGRWAAAVLLALAVLPQPAAARDFPIPEGSAPFRAVGAPSVRPATADMGTFDCDRLRVRITLDNTRSTRAVRFGYSATFVRPLRAPYSGGDNRVDVDVAAGAARLVELPVRDDARTNVTVSLPDGRQANWESSCGNAPRVIFGPSDCAALRMGVLLDNGSSPTPTRFRWALSDPAGRVATNVVKVAAGAVAKADVPIVANSWTAVDMSVDGRGTVANLNRQACGSMVLDPRAVFGMVDCDDVSAPVILDNSRTTARVRFHLPGQDVVLGPGQTRSLRVHLPIRERLAVRVDDVLARGRSVERAVVSTAHCAGAPPQPRTPAAAGRTGPGAVAAPGGAQADTAATTGPAAKDSRPPLVLGFGMLAALVALGLVLTLRRRRVPATPTNPHFTQLGRSGHRPAGL